MKNTSEGDVELIKAKISFDPKGQYSSDELLSMRYGHDIGELRGLIHRHVSFWAVDESGSVGRTKKSLGKAITYSAVTQLGDVDYKVLFKEIPEEIHKDGTEEIHYRYLRENYPELLKTLVSRIGEAPFLILSYPVKKDYVNTASKRGGHRNALYVLDAIQNLIDAIEQVDTSKSIIVSFDRTDEIPENLLQVVWTDKTIVLMSKEIVFELLEISDIASSVTNNAINFPYTFDMELFGVLYPLNTNLSGQGKATTAGFNPGPDKETWTSRYKKITLKRMRQANQTKRERRSKSHNQPEECHNISDNQVDNGSKTSRVTGALHRGGRK